MQSFTPATWGGELKFYNIRCMGIRRPFETPVIHFEGKRLCFSDTEAEHGNFTAEPKVY